MNTTETFTRQQLLANECEHRQYYAQFVTLEYVDYVVVSIGKSNLLESTDKNLNDINLTRWDMLNAPSNFREMLKSVGDAYSLSGKVCVAKEAARQFLDKNR